jgi:hypothetical protein
MQAPSIHATRAGAQGETRAHFVARIAPGIVGLVLAACGHSPPQHSTAPAAVPKPIAVAPIDWLPSASFALLQIDVDQVRMLLPLELLAGKLSPAQHTLLERTHGLILSFGVLGAEPVMAGVFVGDYDARINAMLLTGEPKRRSEDASRELWLSAEDLWLHTPEGHWVAGERELADELLAPPASRAKRLSSEPWTKAPSEPYLASAALHVTPPLQAALREQAQRESYAEMIAQVGPALLELRDVRMTALPEGDGLRLRSSFDFASELGAQSGALVLRGLLALLSAAGAPDPHLGTGSPDGALVAAALDGAQVEVVGRQVRAEMTLDGPQLAALGRLLEEGEPDATLAADGLPAYEPPTAEQLAERHAAVRANAVFAKVLDRVLAEAGADLELRDGLHPQTGKAGTPFLLVRVEQPSAPAQRQRLQAALRGKGLQVVPVARGFEGRPTELGIFRARDEAAVLVARGSGEARAAGTSKQLAALVRSWQKRASVQVAVAADDYVAFELTAVPADPDRFVRELLELCPDAKADEQRTQLLEQRRLDCFLR